MRSNPALLAVTRPRLAEPQLARYCPHEPHPKQAAFLLLDHVREVFFGGAGGGWNQKAVYQLARRTKMTVKEVVPGKGDKLVKATKGIVLAHDGRVYLPESATWLDDALGELTRFTGDEGKDAHDDVVDNLSMAAGLREVKERQQHQGFAPHVIQRS